MREQLVTPAERWLYHGGCWCVAGGLLMRRATDLWRESWLMDSQLLAGLLLLAALLAAAAFISGAPGRSAVALLGGAGWLLGLSLIPRYLWPTGERPAWQLWYAAALLAIALFASWRAAQQYSRSIRGRGYAALIAGAANGPLRRRLHAARVMRTLGYRYVPQE